MGSGQHPSLMNPDSGEDSLPLSALNHYSYCERRCALIHLEGVFVENAYTIEGSLLHETADTPGYENLPGVRVIRALPIFSSTLGLTGKADIVEFRNGVPFPVDYKRGKRHEWRNDDIQLCAQGLCLEEMFGIAVPAGAVFHAASRRRREVAFDQRLRTLTEQTIDAVRRLLHSRNLPPARLKPQCDGCSLHEVCMPEVSRESASGALRILYRIDPV